MEKGSMFAFFFKLYRVSEDTREVQQDLTQHSKIREKKFIEIYDTISSPSNVVFLTVTYDFVLDLTKMK